MARIVIVQSDVKLDRVDVELIHQQISQHLISTVNSKLANIGFDELSVLPPHVINPSFFDIDRSAALLKRVVCGELTTVGKIRQATFHHDITCKIWDDLLFQIEDQAEP